MRYLVTIDSRQISIQDLDLAAGRATVDGQARRFDFKLLQPGTYSLIIDHRVYTARVERGETADEISIGSYRTSALVEDERAALLRKLAHTEQDTGPLDVTSPIPGLVVRVFAGPGEHVQKGQRLLTIEAMKMENEIKSPLDGIVAEVFARERDVVDKGGRLMRLRRLPSGKL